MSTSQAAVSPPSPTLGRLLRVPDVSAKTGIPQDTLRQWRSRGYGPRSFRLGKRIVYAEADVDSWVAEQILQTSSGGNPAA